MLLNWPAPGPLLFPPISSGNQRDARTSEWHVACRDLERVSSVTKSAAVFLVKLILSPVTEPFASFPLSALMGHMVDSHASVTVTQSDGRLASSTFAGTVFVEEQMK